LKFFHANEIFINLYLQIKKQKKMKLLKWSWLGVFALAFVLIACQKDVGSPSETSAAKKGGESTPTVQFNPNAADWIFSAVVNQCPLSLVLTAQNPGGQTPGNGTITVSFEGNIVKSGVSPLSLNAAELDIAEGESKIFDIEYAVGNGNAEKIYDQIQVWNTGLCPEDPECNTGVLNQRFEIYFDSEGGLGSEYCTGIVGYKAIYMVDLSNVCESNVAPLKLQGGLTNGATVLNTTSPIGAANTIRAAGGGNTVVTWTNVTASGDYEVWFNKSKSTKATDYATGEWSLKDALGTLVGGYTARMTFGNGVCP
jgi:hypothetical protein